MRIKIGTKVWGQRLVAFYKDLLNYKSKGHCTLSPKCSHAFFRFFVFLILSHQNACYGYENAENRTWSEFFYDGRKFQRQCVNVIDTTWGHIYFLTYENFRWKLRTQCAMTLRVIFFYYYFSLLFHYHYFLSMYNRELCQWFVNY